MSLAKRLAAAAGAMALAAGLSLTPVATTPANAQGIYFGTPGFGIGVGLGWGGYDPWWGYQRTGWWGPGYGWDYRWRRPARRVAYSGAWDPYWGYGWGPGPIGAAAAPLALAAAASAPIGWGGYYGPTYGYGPQVAAYGYGPQVAAGPPVASTRIIRRSRPHAVRTVQRTRTMRVSSRARGSAHAPGYRTTVGAGGNLIRGSQRRPSTHSGTAGSGK